MRRRRFLSLAAAMACAPGFAVASEWRGMALGAEVSVRLEGDRETVDAALAGVPALLREVEGLFSLYDPNSRLSALNRDGRLSAPPQRFLSLLRQVDDAHRLTGGLFDPTVQPLWRALATGAETSAARAAIGWDRVRVSDASVHLDHGQALTLNGIAQGFATDLLRDRLAARGFSRALIDLGETRALGGPFRLALRDPAAGDLGAITLDGSAVATSSPPALMLGAQSHILSPDGRAPLWSTVSIEAETATLADALSTAAVFLPLPDLHALKRAAGLRRIVAVDGNGALRTV